MSESLHKTTAVGTNWTKEQLLGRSHEIRNCIANCMRKRRIEFTTEVTLIK
jgi:hypothetical protein